MAESISQKTDRELCQIIATSISNIVSDSLNPSFRQNYFDIIQVSNSTDAQNSLENRLLSLIGEPENTLCEKNANENDKPSLEDYIASKILRPSDAMNTHKYSEMISLIKRLVEIDPNANGHIRKYNNAVSTAGIFPSNLIESVESTQMEL